VLALQVGKLEQGMKENTDGLRSTFQTISKSIGKMDQDTGHILATFGSGS
jgi:hypothetical protein